MRRILLIALVWALSLFAGSGREVKGYVVDAQTGAPIARARVTVTFFGSGESTSVQLLTDEGGAFLLKNAPEGHYQVLSQRSGYLSGSPVTSMVGSSSSEANAAPLTIRLTPQAVMEVTVEDETGATVRFASVQLFHRAIVEGHRLPQESSQQQTDDAGTARFFGLSGGHYLAEARAPTGVAKGAKMAYPQVFYPNSPDIRGAEQISLQPGQELHLRLRLPRQVPAREIRGQVAPAGDSVVVQLRRSDDTPNLPPVSVPTYLDPKTNNFKISGVTPGAHVLDVASRLADQQLRDSLPLTVAERDISGIRLQPHVLPTLSGRITVEGKEGPPDAHPAISISSPRGRFGMDSNIDDHFEFKDMLEGTYQLIPPMGALYIRSAWQGGRDALRDGLIISPELTPEPLEIVLSGPGATVEGTVSLPDSAGSMTLTVVLLRRAGDRLVLEKEVQVSSSLPDGAVMWVSKMPAVQGGNHFKIEGAGPGDHLLYCWYADSPMAYADPGFLEEYGALGKTITVTGTDKVSVKLESVLPRMLP